MIHFTYVILPTQSVATCDTPNIHIIALPFSDDQQFPPIPASSCQSQGNREKEAQRIKATLISTPIEGAEDLLEDVGWDPSTVPETLPELSEPPETSSSEEQLEPKGYQQSQPAAITPGSTGVKQ